MLGGPPSNRFGREAHAVRIDNIAGTVGRHEIIDLFSNLIGQVRRCEEVHNGQERWMDMAFFSRDCARKALCMSGYTVSGVPLSVQALAPAHSQRRQDRFNQPDERRNLYVLGLPFNLTKTEFTELFARYGAVEHSVILATVDNASRRRGFIVMANHIEAKAAMDNLSRAEIKGHVVDVSWAVVQRSQGFLDGGDRSVPSDDGSGPIGPLSSMHEPRRAGSLNGGYIHPKRDDFSRVNTFHGHGGRNAHAGSFDSTSSSQSFSRPMSYGEYSPPATASARTTILVSNISALLFATEVDLRPLLGPYGDIRRMEIIRSMSSMAPSLQMPSKPASPVDDNSSSHDRQQTAKVDSSSHGKISVIVQYADADMAIDACAGLEGQVYGGLALTVEYYDVRGAGSSGSPTRSIPSLASSLSSAPSSTSEFPDFSTLSIRDSGYDKPKRHSLNDIDPLNAPMTADPRVGWQVGRNPYVEFTPCSPPSSARSLGGWPASDRYGLPPPRGYNPAFRNDNAAFRNDGLVAPHRVVMYDRSNNTSPFGSAVFPPSTRPYSPGFSGYPRGPYADSREGEAENKFGAIARPLSAVPRLPPSAPGDLAVHVPPASASNGNSPPHGIPRTKYDELRYDEYQPSAFGRPSRAFNSMPDVFDFPAGQVPPRV